METKPCFHCGLDTTPTEIIYDHKSFCCNGCKTVYEIFSANDLSTYYELQKNPGATPKVVPDAYSFLDHPKIVEKLLEFDADDTQIVNLYIPHIHCSSCIWILENLNKLNPAIGHAVVTFGKKTVRITYNSQDLSLKALVTLLGRIGYEPFISLDDYKKRNSKTDRSLLYKLGVAGFAFGNIMFLSFPEYFQVNEFWLEQFKYVFRWLIFAFALPVVFYSAQSYFISAYKGLKSKILNIDVPIALGIIVLFLRSAFEIIFDQGTGFFDSLSGLVFFLLLGRFFQKKTYDFLSFERDYKSYFPIGVTKLSEQGKESPIQVYDVQAKDRLLIRNEELIPVDCVLTRGAARIDYSFVTGESKTVSKKIGDKLYAGGKQLGGSIEVETLKTMTQSYLTQLWSNDVFSKSKTDSFTTLTNKISKRFTLAVLSIATLATLYWVFADVSKALNVFTAVLIIACPCAIALAAPFTFGNLIRHFGTDKFYIKNAAVIEQLAAIDTLVFDKTGTLTTASETHITHQGTTLSKHEKDLLKSSLRSSNHPLSRALYNTLDLYNTQSPDHYEEHLGAGIIARYADETVRVGSAVFVKHQQKISPATNTSVHLSINNIYKGAFTFYNQYRSGLTNLFDTLAPKHNLVVLSGDNAGEEANLKKRLPTKTKLIFNQKPMDKLAYIKQCQNSGNNVLMVGDGLNDAGALAQSDVGIAIAENVNVFSPACDAILDASNFSKIGAYIAASKAAVSIIKWGFGLSFVYNSIGLYFAVTGQLAPVIAAILMPLSSISIVFFTTVSTNFLAKRFL